MSEDYERWSRDYDQRQAGGEADKQPANAVTSEPRGKYLLDSFICAILAFFGLMAADALTGSSNEMSLLIAAGIALFMWPISYLALWNRDRFERSLARESTTRWAEDAAAFGAAITEALRPKERDDSDDADS
ncbi:hypothetical protein ACYPKM_04885 [Pseudomonas aeruginosa]